MTFRNIIMMGCYAVWLGDEMGQSIQERTK